MPKSPSHGIFMVPHTMSHTFAFCLIAYQSVFLHISLIAYSFSLSPIQTWLLTKKMAREGEQRLAFTIPIHEPLPTQYFIK